MKKALIIICLILTSHLLTSQIYVTGLHGEHIFIDADIWDDSETTPDDSIIETWFTKDFTDSTDTLTAELLEIESSQITDIIKTLNQNITNIAEMIDSQKKQIALLTDRQKYIIKELKKLKSK